MDPAETTLIRVDILVGAAMGAFVGYLVPSLHEIESL